MIRIQMGFRNPELLVMYMLCTKIGNADADTKIEYQIRSEGTY
jgi:hypothetical protein